MALREMCKPETGRYSPWSRMRYAANGSRQHQLHRTRRNETMARNCFANPLPTLEVAPQGVGVELFATFRLRTLAKSWR